MPAGHATKSLGAFELIMAVAECDIITGLHPIELSPLPAKPLVSILISNYNYARYIGESIQSVLDQTYPIWNSSFATTGRRMNRPA